MENNQLLDGSSQMEGHDVTLLYLSPLKGMWQCIAEQEVS